MAWARDPAPRPSGGLFLAVGPDGSAAADRTPRRLAQLGVSSDDAECAVVVIERALAAEGPLTRLELAERMASKGIPTQGQATPQRRPLVKAKLMGLGHRKIDHRHDLRGKRHPAASRQRNCIPSRK